MMIWLAAGTPQPEDKGVWQSIQDSWHQLVGLFHGLLDHGIELAFAGLAVMIIPLFIVLAVMDS